MAMMVSPEVAKLFQVLTGEEWPDANEDQLRAFSAEWATAAQALGTQLGPGLRGAVQAMRQNFEGEAERAFVARVSPFIEGDNYIDAAAELFAKLSDFLADLARDVEYMKLVSIYSLIALIAEIAWAIAMSPFTGGGSMAWLAARMAIVRFLLKSLLGKLLLQVLQAAVFGIAFQLLIDAAAQATQFAMGTRDEWNTKYTANAAGVGAMGAALAPFFSGFGKLLSDKLTKLLDDYFTKSLGKAWHKNLPKIITEMGTEAFHETLTEALYKYATEGEFEMNPYSATSGAASGGGSAGGDAFGKYAFNVPPDGGPSGGPSGEGPRGGPPDGESGGGNNNPTGDPGGSGGNGPNGGPGGGPNGGPGGGPNGGPGGGPNSGPGNGPNGGLNNGGGGVNGGPNSNTGGNGGFTGGNNNGPGGLNGDQPRGLGGGNETGGFGNGTNTPSNDPFSPQGNGNSGPTDIVAGPNPTETGNQNSTTPATVPPPVTSPESVQTPENVPPTQDQHIPVPEGQGATHEQSPDQTPPGDSSPESGPTTPVTEQPASHQPVPDPISEQPSNGPVSHQPVPNPITEQPPNGPVSHQPVPDPITEQPPHGPVSQEPVLDPVIEQPPNGPVSHQPVSDPITEPPSNGPVSHQPTPNPITEQPSNGPVSQEPVPNPTPPAFEQPPHSPVVPPPTSDQQNSIIEPPVPQSQSPDSAVIPQPIPESNSPAVPPPVNPEQPVPVPPTDSSVSESAPPPIVGQTGQMGQIGPNSTSPTPTPTPVSANSAVPATNQVNPVTKTTETASRTVAPEMRPGPSTQDTRHAVATLGMTEPATSAETHELTSLPAPPPVRQTQNPSQGKVQDAEQAAEAAATARDAAASASGRARHADRQAHHHLAVTQRSVNDALGTVVGAEAVRTRFDQRARDAQRQLDDATRTRDDLANQHEQAADNLALAQNEGAGDRIRRWATTVRQLTGPLDAANTTVDQAIRNLTTARSDVDAVRISVDTARDAHTKAQTALDNAQQAADTTADALQRANDNLTIANTAATDAVAAVDTVRAAVDHTNTARTDADNATTLADTARDHVTDLIKNRDTLTEQITDLDQQLTEENPPPDLQTRRDALAEQRHTLDTTTIPQAITEADTRTDEANDAHTRQDDAVRTVDTRLADVTTNRDTARDAETAANTGRDDAQQAAKDAEKAKDDAQDAATRSAAERGLTRLSTLPPNSRLHIENLGSLNALVDVITTLTGQDRTSVDDQLTQLGPDGLADAINNYRLEITTSDGPVPVAISADLHRPVDTTTNPTTKRETSAESAKPLSESSSSSMPVRIPLVFVSPVDGAGAVLRPVVYVGATMKRAQRFDSSTTPSSSTGTEQAANVPITIAITATVPNQPSLVAPVDAGLRLPDVTPGRSMTVPVPPAAAPTLGLTPDQSLTYVGTTAVDHSNSSSHSNGSSITRGSDANFGAGLYGGPKGWFLGAFTDFSTGLSDGTNPANENSSSHSSSDVELVYQVDDQPHTVQVPLPVARSLGLPLPPHLTGSQAVTNAQPEYHFGKDDIRSVNNQPVVDFLTDGLGDRGRDAVTDKFATPERSRDSIYNAMHGGEQAVWQENGRTHVVDIFARPAPPAATTPSGQTSTSAEDKNADQFRRTIDSKRTARVGVGGAFLPTGTDTPNPNAPKATPEAGNPNPYQGGPTTSGGAPRAVLAATWESGYGNKSGYTGKDGRGSSYGGDIRDFDGPLDFVVVHRSTKTPNWAQRLFLGDRLLFGPDATSRVTEPTKTEVDQAFAGNQPPAANVRTGRVDDAIHVSTPSDKLPWATKPLPPSQMTPGVYLGDPPAAAPKIDPKALGEFTNVENVRITPNTTEGVYLALAKRVEPVNGGHDLPARVPPVGSGTWSSWGSREFTETRTNPDGTQTVTRYTYKNSELTRPGTTSGDAVRDFVGRVGGRGTASRGIGGLSNSTGRMHQPGRLTDFNGELKATSEYSSPRLVDVRAEGTLKRNQAGDHIAGSTQSSAFGLDAEVSLGVAPKRDSGVGALLRGVFGGGWKSGSSHAVDLTSGGKQAHEYTGPTAFVAMDVRYQYEADLNLRNVFKTNTFGELPVTVDQPDGVLVEMPVAHAIDLFNSLDLPVPPDLAGALPDATSTVDNPAHTLLRGDGEYASHSDTTVIDSTLTGDNPLGPVADKLTELGVKSDKWRTEILDQAEKMLATPAGHVWLRDVLVGDTGLISVPNADVAFEDVIDIRVTATPNDQAPAAPPARTLVPDKQVNADYVSSSTQDKKSTTWTAAAALEAGVNHREVPSVPPGPGAAPNAGASSGSFTPQIIGVSRSVKTEDVLPSSGSEKLTTQVDTNKVGRSGHGVDYQLSISRRRTPMPAFDTPLLGLPKRANWDTAPGDPIPVSGTVDLVSPRSDASPPLTRPAQPPATEVVARRPDRTPMFGPKDGWRIESLGTDTVRAIRDAVYSQLGGRPLPMGPATPEAVTDSAAQRSDHTRPGGNAEYTVHGATLGTSLHHGSTAIFTGDSYHVENIVGRKHTFHDSLFDLTVTADFHPDSFRFVAPLPDGTIMNLSQDKESGTPEGSSKTVSVSSGPSLPWSVGNTHNAAGPAPTTVVTGPPVSEGVSSDTTTATTSKTGETTGVKHTGRSYLYRADADFYTEARQHGSNWTHGVTDSVVKVGSRDDLHVRVWENEALDKGLLTIADVWDHGGKQPPAGLSVTGNDRGATLHPTGQPAPNPPAADTPTGRNLHVAPNATMADVKSFVGSLPKDMRPTTYTVHPDATFTPADIRAEVTTEPATVPTPLPAPAVVPTDSLGARQRGGTQQTGESSTSQPRSAPPPQQQAPVQVRSHQEIAAWFSDALRKFGLTPFLSGGAALGFQQGSRPINDLDFRITVSDAEFRQFGEDGGKRLLTYLNDVMVKDLQREYRAQRGNTPGGKVEQFFPLGGPDGSRTIGSPNVLGHEVSVSVVPGDTPPTIAMDLDGSGRQVDVLVPEELRADKLRTMISRTKTGDESVKKVAQDLFDFLDAMDLIDGRTTPDSGPDSLPERTADHVADSVTARFGQYRDGNLDGQQLHHLGDSALFDLMLARAVLTARAHVQHGPRRDALDAILKNSAVRSGGPHGLRLTDRLQALADLPVPPGVTTELRPWMRSWNDQESFGPPPGRSGGRPQWRPGAEAGELPPTESQVPPPPAVSDILNIHADDLDATVRAAVPKSSTDIEQVVRVLAFSGGFRGLTDSRSDRQTLEAFGLTKSAFGKAFRSLREAGLVAPNAVGLSLTRAGWSLVPTSGPSRLLGPDGTALRQPSPQRPFTPDELNTIDDMSREARTNLDALTNQVRHGLHDRSARVLSEAGWQSAFPSRSYRQAVSIVSDALQDGAHPTELRDLARTLHDRRNDYYRPPSHTTDALAGPVSAPEPRSDHTPTDTVPEPRPGKRSRDEFEADGPVTVPEPPHTRPVPEQLIAPAPEDTAALLAAVPPGTRFADPATFVELINGSRSGHGRDVNCVDAALAFHATWHGDPRVAGIAADGAPRSAATAAAEELSYAPELVSRGEPGLAEIVERITRAGHGADALVFGFPRSGQGHAWNVVNHHGVVSFVDAQDGAISPPTTNPVPGLDRVYAIPLDADGNFITEDAGPPAPPATPDPYAAAEHARAVEAHELRAAAAAGQEIPVPGTTGRLVPSLGGLRLVGAVVTAELAAALSATTGRDVIALVVGPDAEYPEFLRFIPRGRPLPV